MEKTHVKLRPDLEIHREANSSIIVKDPIVNRFYRFAPVQASVLELLKKQLDFNSIAETASREHCTEVLESQVKEFVEKLQSLLLLDNAYCRTRLSEFRHGGKSRRRNLLSIKIHVFNPDDLLAGLEKKTRFFFSSSFLILTSALSLTAISLGILNWESIFFSFGKLFSLYSIPSIAIVVCVLMTAHEFAHGIALKRFGGKVPEMGFLILYFIPAFYCNVSDAWMLKKRERLIVTLAGSYIQIFLGACAMIAWRLLSPETLASRACLIAIGFTGVMLFLNLNPLIRLDGYYLLSDIVEIPNLRPKALAFLKNKLADFIAGTPVGKSQSPGKRETRILLSYGLASFCFTAILLLIIVLRLGGWMIQEYQGFGLFLGTVFLLAAVPFAARENAAYAKTLVRSAVKRIQKNPWTLILLLLIVAASMLPWELKVSGDFTVLALQRISVTPQVAGNLKAIYVDQGDRVRSGDLLAEIENLDLVNSFQETAGELASQKASLDLLRAGSRPEEIEKARRLIEAKNAEFLSASRVEKSRELLLETIDKKAAELENARLNFERTQSLLKDGLIARNDADRDRTAHQVRQKELQEARGQLAVLEEQTERSKDVKRKELAHAESELRILLAGTRKESIRALEAQVKKLEEKLAILKKQTELLKIKSPMDGVVASPYLRNRLGDYLGKGNTFCELVSEGTVRIEMPVPEKEIDVVSLGLPIAVKVRGFPKRKYEARVKSIAPVADSNGLQKTLLVHGELANPDGSLRAGMTGVGKILCGKRKIAEIATRRIIRWLRTEFWEYLP